MPDRQYNLNTKYGRRKARQQAQENYNNMSPQEQADRDFWGCLVMAIIFFVVCVIVLLASGPEGLLNYLKK